VDTYPCIIRLLERQKRRCIFVHSYSLVWFSEQSTIIRYYLIDLDCGDTWMFAVITI